ncbi:MAG: alanyl-tRNA editing protein [Anaerolineae bacterium]|nr:alanyl-tRNA editing protein [Anaerolineae bacterium]
MTTEKLYYTDSYTTTFDAQIIARTTETNRPAVILDRTFFYPTSGGQPHDTGHLNELPVVDVVIRESDEAVLHVLETEPANDTVTGQINWARRFDHMRHHTGQHILSQAFVRVIRAETVGFHLSPDSVTIDLNVGKIKAAAVDDAETLANQIVAENRPVRAWFPAQDELADLSLRKVPDVTGRFRVVDIDGFDITACGGTHVTRTGEIGLIKVLRVDKRGEYVRVEFRCGERALLDYRQKNALMNQLAADLTVGYWEVPDALDRLRAENKALRRDLRAQHEIILKAEADSLWQAADQRDGFRLVVQAFENRDTAEIRQIAQHLISNPATVVVLGAAGSKAQLIAARSDDLTVDMVPALKAGLAVWHVDRGGGRPSFAQGGGAPANLNEVNTALQTAVKTIQTTMT